VLNGAAKKGYCADILPSALVAQLDRASDFESEGREFESLRARQIDMVHSGHMGDVLYRRHR
jgi:hypothetical protein